MEMVSACVFQFDSFLTLTTLLLISHLLRKYTVGFSIRFPALLRSGSLIFKSTRYREWYSERLRAWRDYIPVNYDTSDLGDKLEWANEQDPFVIMNIVKNGKETAMRHIRPEDMQCYMYRMILEYSSLVDVDYMA